MSTDTIPQIIEMLRSKVTLFKFRSDIMKAEEEILEKISELHELLKWIPFDEEKPENEKDYIVKFLVNGEWHHDIMFYQEEDNKWYDHCVEAFEKEGIDTEFTFYKRCDLL